MDLSIDAEFLLEMMAERETLVKIEYRTPWLSIAFLEEKMRDVAGGIIRSGMRPLCTCRTGHPDYCEVHAA